MKKLFILTAAIFFTASGAFAQTANTAPNNNAATAKIKQTKRSKQTQAVPQTDDGIQQCIAQKLAAAPKLGKDNLQSSVANGTATLTGNVPDPGSKGGAGSIAKRCGAKTVVNNITFIAKPKAAKQPKTPKSNSTSAAPPSK